VPTLYKPILSEPESVWANPAKTILDEILANGPEILESLNFYEEHGRPGETEGKFDEQIVRSGNEVLSEMAGILIFAAAQAAEPKAGVKIATLERIRKNPSSAQDRTLPGFAEWILADHYKRDQEDNGTYFPDIVGFVPNGFDGTIETPDEESIIQAASAAIEYLNGNRSTGRPVSEAIRIVSEGLRSIFLRYNEKITRHSEITSRDGRFLQMESGPFFEFVCTVVLPLQNFLVGRNLKQIAASSIVHNGRYPVSSIS